jgi:hypothetical protein
MTSQKRDGISATVRQKPKISRYPEGLKYRDQGNRADIFIYVKCILTGNTELLSVLVSCGAGTLISFPFPLDMTVTKHFSSGVNSENNFF